MTASYNHRIDPVAHRAMLRAQLEGYRPAGPSLPGERRHPRLDISVDPRTGATRVRHPGRPWVSID